MKFPSQLEIAAKRKGRIKRLPKPLAPRNPTEIERQYKRELNKIFSFLADLIRVELLQKLPQLTQNVNALRPTTDAVGDDLKAILGRVRVRFNERFSEEQLKRIAGSYGMSVSEWNKKRMSTNVEKVIGIVPNFSDPFLRDQINIFTAQNADLIVDVTDQTIAKVQSRVLTGFQQGLRHEEIAKNINPIFGRGGQTSKRATLIARDQVSKLNGQLSQLRQTNLGLSRFRWRTVGDDRVRTSHGELNDKVFEWADPPIVDGEISTPGSPINCRCTAEPVFEDLFPDLDLE